MASSSHLVELLIVWSAIDIHTLTLHSLVITAQGPDKMYITFAFVQYRFDGNEHLVRNKPHRNSKSKDPFIPTKKSTLEKLTGCEESSS